MLQTARLHLVQLREDHAPRLAELGNDPLIAAHTANIPSPYTLDIAQAFIHQASTSGDNPTFAVELHDGTLLGVINLKLTPRHRSGHLGYWMGAPFRGHGYMTEAVRAVLGHGFHSLDLHRIQTACFAVNQASARVLEKAGLMLEGRSRQAFHKDGVFHDLLQFGVLAGEWDADL